MMTKFAGKNMKRTAALLLCSVALVIPALALAPYLMSITAERRSSWVIAPSWSSNAKQEIPFA